MQHEERAERLVRRIESFSDLVIGFSLALLALTLKVPAHVSDLIANPWWLIAYFWTFMVISNVWFTHQRLFSHFFWPAPLAIVANFALLALVGLVVYFVQVFVRFPDGFNEIWAFLAYFTATGIAFLLMGSLYLHGLYKRWGNLDADLRLIGARYAARGLIGGVAILAGVVLTAVRQPHYMNDAYTLAYVGAVGMIVARVTTSYLKPRIEATPQNA